MKTCGEYRYVDEITIEGRIKNSLFPVEVATRLTLDPLHRFKVIEVADYRLVRTN